MSAAFGAAPGVSFFLPSHGGPGTGPAIQDAPSGNGLPVHLGQRTRRPNAGAVRPGPR